MEEKIKGCIFDLDGVLTDTVPLHYKSWCLLGEEVGFSLTPDQNKKLKGKGRLDSLNLIIKESNLNFSEREKEEMMEKKNRWFLEEIEQFSTENLFPGALDFLVHLTEKQIPFALASGSKNAKIILEKLGLQKMFQCIFDGNDVSLGKPDPELFVKAADCLSLSDRAEIIVFEDSVAGIEAAHKGGFIAVGFGADPELKERAHLTIENWEGVDIEYLENRLFS
nr:beta-phosphoglucomutase [Saprospiraceae bacterium]